MSERVNERNIKFIRCEPDINMFMRVINAFQDQS